MVDIQSVTTENRRGEKERRKKETTAARYNGLSYWVAIIIGWLEFNVPFQHKYGYIRDEAVIIRM